MKEVFRNIDIERNFLELSISIRYKISILLKYCNGPSREIDEEWVKDFWPIIWQTSALAKMPILTRKASLFSNTDVAIVAKCLVQTPPYKSM